MPLLCYLVETNPNNATGGGGTLAGEMHDADAEGPFFVWPAQEYESAISPTAVVAASEVEHMYRMLHDLGTDVIGGGERMAHDEAVPTPPTTGAESPVFDLDDPAEAADFLKAFSSED